MLPVVRHSFNVLSKALMSFHSVTFGFERNVIDSRVCKECLLCDCYYNDALAGALSMIDRAWKFGLF